MYTVLMWTTLLSNAKFLWVNPVGRWRIEKKDVWHRFRWNIKFQMLQTPVEEVARKEVRDFAHLRKLIFPVCVRNQMRIINLVQFYVSGLIIWICLVLRKYIYVNFHPALGKCIYITGEQNIYLTASCCHKSQPAPISFRPQKLWSKSVSSRFLSTMCTKPRLLYTEIRENCLL